jgi:hypothetical protein
MSLESEMIAAAQVAADEMHRLAGIVEEQNEFIEDIRQKLRGDMRADIGTGRDGWFGVRGETIRLILGD